MSETPSPVFFAEAKPEQSKAVSGVRRAVDKWLERIGPKSVENHFIEAHKNILATLDSNQRKEVFAKEAEKWQKAGKRWGIAATVIDTALIGAGAGLSFIGLRNPQVGAGIYVDIGKALMSRPQNRTTTFLLNLLVFPARNIPIFDKVELRNGKLIDVGVGVNNNTILGFDKLGRTMAIAPALASLGILVGSGPGHWLAHLTAGGKEQIGKMKARTNNYVDSGKAAEHAKAVGGAIGKAATETAKYVAEHPDEIRKTVETVNRVKRQNAESAQKIAQTNQKAEEVKLEKEYQDWVDHHPDKVYYQQSGQPMPSKADYVEMKRRDAAAKQAAREEEKRGEAK